MTIIWIWNLLLFQSLLNVRFVNTKSVAKHQGSSCKDAIGIQTGFLETRDIKTSTSQSNFTATDPWCATTLDDKQFFAVDLGEDFSISKIATQGKLDNQNRFINLYNLEYSSDAKKWTEYQDIFGKSDLDGNKNTYDVTSHDLAPAIIARYVKLKPKKWNNGICATTDLFGCSIIRKTCKKKASKTQNSKGNPKKIISFKS